MLHDFLLRTEDMSLFIVTYICSVLDLSLYIYFKRYGVFMPNCWLFPITHISCKPLCWMKLLNKQTNKPSSTSQGAEPLVVVLASPSLRDRKRTLSELSPVVVSGLKSRTVGGFR